ncbi:hypothetical protein, partial [Parolsenella catena]|uniref:hypothetical protein n=1 Tax=Parolsenella catena TaxID=2003188 RepID=UPI003AEF386D
ACHSVKCESRLEPGGFSISAAAFSIPLLAPRRFMDCLDHDGGAMTLLQLGQIAAKYETEMAHAMLFAVAVAKCYGGGKWIKDIA